MEEYGGYVPERVDLARDREDVRGAPRDRLALPEADGRADPAARPAEEKVNWPLLVGVTAAEIAETAKHIGGFPALAEHDRARTHRQLDEAWDRPTGGKRGENNGEG